MHFESDLGRQVVETYIAEPHMENILSWPSNAVPSLFRSMIEHALPLPQAGPLAELRRQHDRNAARPARDPLLIRAAAPSKRNDQPRPRQIMDSWRNMNLDASQAQGFGMTQQRSINQNMPQVPGFCVAQQHGMLQNMPPAQGFGTIQQRNVKQNMPPPQGYGTGQPRDTNQIMVPAQGPSMSVFGEKNVTPTPHNRHGLSINVDNTPPHFDGAFDIPVAASTTQLIPCVMDADGNFVPVTPVGPRPLSARSGLGMPADSHFRRLGQAQSRSMQDIRSAHSRSGERGGFRGSARGRNEAASPQIFHIQHNHYHNYAGSSPTPGMIHGLGSQQDLRHAASANDLTPRAPVAMSGGNSSFLKCAVAAPEFVPQTDANRYLQLRHAASHSDVAASIHTDSSTGLITQPPIENDRQSHGSYNTFMRSADSMAGFTPSRPAAHHEPALSFYSPDPSVADSWFGNIKANRAARSDHVDVFKKTVQWLASTPIVSSGPAAAAVEAVANRMSGQPLNNILMAVSRETEEAMNEASLEGDHDEFQHLQAQKAHVGFMMARVVQGGAERSHGSHVPGGYSRVPSNSGFTSVTDSIHPSDAVSQKGQKRLSGN
jgi:hypothetical protein